MIEFLPSREVVLRIFGWSLHWYGLLYIASFALAIYILPHLQKWRDIKLSRQDWIEVVSWVAVGVLVGGRLGYVLLYEPISFWIQLDKVFAIWNGGMASHGGFIGVAIAIWLYVKYALPQHLMLSDKSKWNIYMRILDVLIVPIALGLTLGRIGNVINQELFATPLVQGLAITKNIFIAGLCYWSLRTFRLRPGITTSIFLISYGLLRFLIEYLRVQDHSLVWDLTLGQIYTVPIVIVGIGIGLYVKLNKENAKQNQNQ
jgi:phosphatidylglycerol---prolipoprotein diacylglyceryl transferase